MSAVLKGRGVEAGRTAYTVREVCRAVGISARQLGYWRLIGVVSPVVEHRGAKVFYRYGHADVQRLKDVARLTAVGFPVSKAVEWIERGGETQPLMTRTVKG